MSRFVAHIPRLPFNRMLAFCLLLLSCALPLSTWALDTDGDGVDDSIDAFPSMPEATTDTDGDGKPDGIDNLKLPVFNDFESGTGSGWVLNAWYPAVSNWGLSTTYSVSPSHSLHLIAYRDVSHSTNVASLSAVLQTGSTISWYQRGASSIGRYFVEINGVRIDACSPSGSWYFCVAAVTPGSNTFALKADSGTPPMTGSYAEIFVDDLRVGSLLAEDADDDNDGVLDAGDLFPLDATESVDSDNDGIGDNADLDDDNDGVPDVSDAFPLDPSESADTDGDGIGNLSDNCPTVSNANQLDTDGDGAGDACDSTPLGPDTDGDGIVDNSYSIYSTSFETVGPEWTLSGASFSAVNPLSAGGYLPARTGTMALANWSSGCAGYCSLTPHTATLTYNLPYAANIRFWAVSTQTFSDTSLSFLVDNVSAGTVALDKYGYKRVTVPVSAGSHTFKWSTPKDTPRLFVDDVSITTPADNCPSVSNAAQTDTDGDGIGDVCDSTPNGDTDNDGVDNLSDNCPAVSNANQLNTDGDAQGDACDSTPNGDTDGDGIDNLADNCVAVSNANQLNTDGDALGDACDSTPNGDTDNDGVDNLSDNCPAVSNANQLNTDGDAQGDVCDSTPNGDTDGDGVDNLADNCPLVFNANQLNTDADAQGNACDNDDDNDGVPDASDAFPLNASESADADGDGIGNNADNCPLVSNANQLNTDGDAQGDACDVFPNDPVTLLQQDGTGRNEHLGSSVALADMNNDGVVDLVVGSPWADVLRSGKLLKKAGKIQIVSGKDNSVIRTINGSAANQQLGAAIAVVPDQNKDGLRDIVVGDPLADVTQLRYNDFPVLKDAGRVLLYSGKDGRMLRILVEGNTAGDHFGAAVAVGDVNADNAPDLIVGAPMNDVTAKDAGQISVFNGIGKTLLYTRTGNQKAEHFAAAVAVANGHLFVGSPQFDTATAKDAGRVSVFNNSEGNSVALLSVDGAAKADAFGTAITAASDDWAVGISMADSADKNAGSVQMFSGLNATAVKILNGAAAGDNFGSALNMQGDVNNDGANDMAIGAPKFDASATVNSKTVLLKDAGRVQVLSTAGF